MVDDIATLDHNKSVDNLEIVDKPRKKLGRPKGSKNVKPRIDVTRHDVRQALAYHGPKALQVLIEVMNDHRTRVGDRITCAREVLNRAYGMPVKCIYAKVMVKVTVQFLDALKEINARVVELDEE